MRTEFMGYLKGKTVAEMVHGFMDVNKHCQRVALVLKCVQSLILFFSMLASFQPSKNHHHTVRILLTIVGSHPFLNLPLEEKRCLCLNANCQSAMQGRKCPTDVVHPLTYGEETDRVIPVSGVGTVVF